MGCGDLGFEEENADSFIWIVFVTWFELIAEKRMKKGERREEKTNNKSFQRIFWIFVLDYYLLIGDKVMVYIISNSVESDINMCEWDHELFLYENTIIQQSVLKIALK